MAIRILKFILKYFYLFLFLLNLNCATIFFSSAGKLIGNGIDNARFEKKCSAQDLIEEGFPHWKTAKFQLIGGTIGAIIDFPIGLLLAISKPVTGLKIFVGLFYSFSIPSVWKEYSNNYKYFTDISDRNKSWLDEQWGGCKNSADFFYSDQSIDIYLEEEKDEDTEKELCKKETDNLIEMAYLSFTEANFNSSKSNILDKVKQSIPKSDIFQIVNTSKRKYAGGRVNLSCSSKVLFNYSGGKKKLIKDFNDTEKVN